MRLRSGCLGLNLAHHMISGQWLRPWIFRSFVSEVSVHGLCGVPRVWGTGWYGPGVGAKKVLQRGETRTAHVGSK